MGLTIQAGERRASWKKYESIEDVYVASLGYNTLSWRSDAKMEHGAEPLAVTAFAGEDVIKNVTVSSGKLKRYLDNMLKADWLKEICLRVERRAAYLYMPERQTFEAVKEQYRVDFGG